MVTTWLQQTNTHPNKNCECNVEAESVSVYVSLWTQQHTLSKEYGLNFSLCEHCEHSHWFEPQSKLFEAVQVIMCVAVRELYVGSASVILAVCASEHAPLPCKLLAPQKSHFILRFV